MFSDRQMYALVNDVGSYPEFMDGCQKTEIHQQTDSEMVATLHLRKSGVNLAFTTRNVLSPYEKITLNLDSGPFKKLQGEWRFKALSNNACKVSLDLNFEFNSVALGLAGSSLFSSVANSLVDALCKRAEDVYR